MRCGRPRGLRWRSKSRPQHDYAADGITRCREVIGMIRKFVADGRSVFVYGINYLDFAALGCQPWEKSFSDWLTLEKKLRPCVGRTAVF